MKHALMTKGIWEITHKDKTGKIISSEKIHNLITNEGQNYMLNSAVHGGSQISDWYIAPFTDDYTPLAANTYATPGFTEVTTQIDEATRQAWDEGESTAQSVTNAVAATITANTDVTIYGFGIVGGGSAATTKGDAAGGGTLLSSGRLTTAKTLASGETLDLTYTLQTSN